MIDVDNAASVGTGRGAAGGGHGVEENSPRELQNARDLGAEIQAVRKNSGITQNQPPSSEEATGTYLVGQLSCGESRGQRESEEANHKFDFDSVPNHSTKIPETTIGSGDGVLKLVDTREEATTPEFELVRLCKLQRTAIDSNSRSSL